MKNTRNLGFQPASNPDSITWKKRESAHYAFHYYPMSVAEKEIDQIIASQEYCYLTIIERLVVDDLPFPIQYFLYDSPVDVGKQYAQFHPDEPVSSCNGFSYPPEQIHAVYTHDIHCMGYHEDVHIISDHFLGKPKCYFIQEGLAMCFDRTWWGIPNSAWTKFYIEKNEYPTLKNLVDNTFFDVLPEELTYPTAGSFVDYLLQRYGRDDFIAFYELLAFEEIQHALEKSFSTGFEKLDNDFSLYVLNTAEDMTSLIKERLKV